MANYRLYKSNDYTRVPAFLEDRTDGKNITFMRFLKPEYAQYVPVELLIPADLHPDVYESQYGERLLRMNAPECCAFRDMEPAVLRLPVETVGGKDYAFRDFRAMDYFTGEFVGRTYRVRIAFERVRKPMTRRQHNALRRQYDEWTEVIHATKLQIENHQYDTDEEFAALQAELAEYQAARADAWDAYENAVIIDY